MVRVRFPNGQCIQYNDVSEVEWQNNAALELIRKDASGKRWMVAVIAPGTQFLYEWAQPCAITNPVARELSPESALDLVKKHLRSINTDKIKDLKLALRSFNARRHRWKD